MSARPPADPAGGPDERAALAGIARGGLCGDCAHARLVTSSRGSAFLRCAHPVPPKYPPQPRPACAAHRPLGRAAGEERP